MRRVTPHTDRNRVKVVCYQARRKEQNRKQDATDELDAVLIAMLAMLAMPELGQPELSICYNENLHPLEHISTETNTATEPGRIS